MQIEKNKSLKEFNSFGIECTARNYISVSTTDELKEILQLEEYQKKFILGGGSNILFTRDLDELVIHIDLKGIFIRSKDDDHITLEIMAGENWHELVEYCIDKDYGGIENLSLIPGKVGAAPIQNIGAYGVELKDVIVSCKAISLSTFKERVFTKEECNFGYRNSIFKKEEKGNYIITSVLLKLTRRNHKINAEYGAIRQLLEDKNIAYPSIRDISEAVMEIRRSKLPDPRVLGNGGSFFKNPVVDGSIFSELNENYPNLPYYQVSVDNYKIPAGWLIETAGFKGKRYGEVGVHKDQALVLVNFGDAKGHEIRDLAFLIQKEIKKKFGILLEPEVNII
jgi:UDP-N-acetylmuramate dehydrogenase